MQTSKLNIITIITVILNETDFRLQDQLDNLNCKDVNIDVKDLRDILARKRRQIKKKKDKLKPLQDEGWGG